MSFPELLSNLNRALPLLLPSRQEPRDCARTPQPPGTCAPLLASSRWMPAPSFSRPKPPPPALGWLKYQRSSSGVPSTFPSAPEPEGQLSAFRQPSGLTRHSPVRLHWPLESAQTPRPWKRHPRRGVPWGNDLHTQSESEHKQKQPGSPTPE